MRVLCALLMCLTVATGAWGQAEVPPKAPASVVHCKNCHTNDAPTKENPSLVQCPRTRTKGVHSTEEAPPILTLGQPGGHYDPVEFSHKTHAEMSEMGGGCYQCHHYDQGGRIQKCEECHSRERARTDVGKPDLSGALHRLCVDCHRQWSHSTDCATCHGDKPMPKAQSPKRGVYETNYPDGAIVTFFHEEHVTRFGLKCADCHQKQSCAGCHDPKKEKERVSLPLEDHQACSSCHANDECSSCHSTEPMGAFDHGKRTGWIQNRFHLSLECQRCHTTPGKFTKIDTGCESCHPGWRPKFDHTKVGIAFDEMHASLECESCHTGDAFATPPACADCHDDKSYPQDTPGQRVGAAGKP